MRCVFFAPAFAPRCLGATANVTERGAPHARRKPRQLQTKLQYQCTKKPPRKPNHNRRSSRKRNSKTRRTRRRRCTKKTYVSTAICCRRHPLQIIVGESDDVRVIVPNPTLCVLAGCKTAAVSREVGGKPAHAKARANRSREDQKASMSWMPTLSTSDQVANRTAHV